MYCPNCKQEYDGKFCPECGTKLIEKPATSGVNLNLGDANAISGGLHVSDSHDVTNVDNSVHNITNNTSTVNNITNVAAQKTESEILQERKIEFMEAVKQVFADGLLEQDEVMFLERERLRIGLDEVTAKRLIETARKSTNEVRQTLSPTQAFMLKQIKQVIKSNQIDQIKRLLPRLETIAKSTLDEESHYLYGVALAATDPQKLINEYEALTGDDYWQTYWAYIAYTKLGDFKKAEEVLLVLPRYTQYSEENETLLTAVGAMREFGADTAFDFLNTITGMYSNTLENFVMALFHLLEPDAIDIPEDAAGSVNFYMENILQFEDAEERARREAEERARAAAESAKLYNLKLKAAGSNSFKVAMVLKSGLNITLSEAKALIEVCPIDIVKQQTRDKIQPLLSALQNAGAEVEMI